MRESLIVVSFFALGALIGWSGVLSQSAIDGDYIMYALYFLMFQVGLNLGSDKKLKSILAAVSPRMLLIPLATIGGTLGFSALIGLFLSRWSVFDCMAVGSGFGYYSLSSILITQYKEATLGVQLATELGTIALLTNVFREMFTLLCAPLLVKYFGRLAPICTAGVTSIDVSLPVITRYSGKDLISISVIHGILVDLTVPFFVSFFCSM